jgi:hypothetical protein
LFFGYFVTSSEVFDRRRQNKEAYEHDDEGEKYFKQKNFERTYIEFDQAHSKCSENYKYERLFSEKP